MEFTVNSCLNIDSLILKCGFDLHRNAIDCVSYADQNGQHVCRLNSCSQFNLPAMFFFFPTIRSLLSLSSKEITQCVNKFSFSTIFPLVRRLSLFNRIRIDGVKKSRCRFHSNRVTRNVSIKIDFDLQIFDNVKLAHTHTFYVNIYLCEAHESNSQILSDQYGIAWY